MGCRFNKGFSLLEITLAGSIFFLVMLCASRLLYFTASAGGVILVKQELQENARAAMDILTANIHLAEEIKLTGEPNGLLKSLILTEIDDSGNLKEYEFRYQPSQNRLNFGGTNELALYLRQVSVQKRGDYLWICITTDDHVKSNPQIKTAAVTLRAVVNIKGKKFIKN